MITEMLRMLSEHGLSDDTGFRVSLPEQFGSTAGFAPVPVIDMRATVAVEVIPRLRAALAGRIAASAGGAVANRRDDAPDKAIDILVDRLVADDFEGVCAQVRTLHASGVMLERVYVSYLMPAAVRLTEQYESDLLGLAETTIAFCNLQRLLRHFAPDFYAEEGQAETGLRALFVAPAAPGVDPNLPVFGLLLMSEFFRREGWDAWTERNCKGGSFRDTVLTEWFDLVEVLAHSDRDLDDIASGIRLIRRDSPNPAVGVIACGRVFHDHPELVRMVGADRSASDPITSLTQAKNLVALQASRHLLS